MAFPGRSPRAVVIGGGVGGLACAIDLQRRGVEVRLLERAAAVGGKMRQVRVGGQGIDAGPTVLTMRWVFEGLFADAGTSLAEQVGLGALEVLARHAWQDGSRLDLFADQERTAAAIAEFAGAAEARGFRRFSAHTEAIYRQVSEPFIGAARPTLPSLAASLGFGGLRNIFKIDFHRSMWKALGDFFKDPRLRQLFGRYATYYGSDPFTAPATLNLIAHVEQLGVWTVDGGMLAMATAMARVATQLGVEIRCGAEVSEITSHGGKVRGVVLADGTAIAADAVIFNGDVAALGEGRLGPACAGAVKAPQPARRSLSAVTWASLARVRGWPLLRHNVCFSRDYAGEFTALARDGRVPDEPTVYLCAQDRSDRAEPAAEDPQRILILINAPPRGGQGHFTAPEIDACQSATLQLLRRCGLEVTMDPSATEVTTPNEFAAMFPGSGGALYGSATRGWTDSLTRHASRTKLAGLYLAGGSVHPGAGVPMATLSGRYAARSVCEDLASTEGWRPAGTAGGTSTRSATTAVTG
ncbi:MAG: phytoene desaturase [Nannocystis sp.]|nr:1-hydroxycarotenoid 3,4-desaturase CrtD [Nannocystis sp.]MBA3549531.1 phytoene desaturase [Nannocystis sp.]